MATILAPAHLCPSALPVAVAPRRLGRSSGARGRRQRRAAPNALGLEDPSDSGLLYVTHTRKVRQTALFRHRRNSRVLDLQEAWKQM